MTKQKLKSEIIYITAILIHYGFDLEGNHPQNLINKWIREYEPHWIRYALLEALYQGRYKAISVEQLLWGWKRRGRTVYHFNREFERLICRKFPDKLTDMITSEFIFSYSYPVIIPDEQPSQLNQPTITPINFEDPITSQSDFPIETTSSNDDLSEPNINPDQNFDLDQLRSKFIPQRDILEKNAVINQENNQQKSEILEEILLENHPQKSEILADFFLKNTIINQENHQQQPEILEEILPENYQQQPEILEKILPENHQQQPEILEEILPENHQQQPEILEKILPENHQQQPEILEEIFSENDLIATENIPSQSALSEENQPTNQPITREKILPKPKYKFIDRINTLIKQENQRAKSAEENKSKTDQNLSITDISVSENLPPEQTAIFAQLPITDIKDQTDTNNINKNIEINQNSIDLQEIFSDDYADEIEIIHPITENISNNSSGDYESRKKPIEQFIPEENQSQFYLKLKALAEGENKS